MTRSHHRKKHKEKLRLYKRDSEATTFRKTKGRTAPTFAVIGGVAGFVIGYFATDGIILWMTIGLVAGGAIGYLIGKKMDTESTK